MRKITKIATKQYSKNHKKIRDPFFPKNILLNIILHNRSAKRELTVAQTSNEGDINPDMLRHFVLRH